MGAPQWMISGRSERTLLGVDDYSLAMADDIGNHTYTRRTVLAASLGAVAAACGSSGDDAASPEPTAAPPDPTATPEPDPTAAPPDPTATPEPPPEPTLLDGVFALGVASGDPLTDRVILWTRLVVEPQAADGGMPAEDVEVTWEVATDDTFADVVSNGTHVATADHVHSVHVDADGLAPGTWYAYRFVAGGRTSPTGRTRTLPEGSVDQFRFVVASCQEPQFGEYGAWADVASLDDLDAVIFAGDYIYELPKLDLAGDGHREWWSDPPTDLDGFRLRYAQVRSDGSIQAAHAAAPWWVMWDDHEITDNYWSGGGGLFDSAGGPIEPRRVAAYQAWWEHQPVRLAAPADGLLDVHRSAVIGDLADLILIDTRQHADEPPCRDSSVLDFGLDCEARNNPDLSLLGADQEAWLLDELSAASATWTVLMTPVMFSGIDGRDDADEPGPGLYLESWDGYPAARQRIADALRAKPSPMVVSGDFHASIALDCGPGFGDAPICPEFLAPGISSFASGSGISRDLNPHVRHMASDNGYILHTVTPDEWRAEFRIVADIWDPASPVEISAAFTAAPGDTTAQPA